MRILVLMLFLVSCTVVEAETPPQRYFALKESYASLLKVAIAYKEKCDYKPDENPCYGYVDKIRVINNNIRNAFDSADRAGARTNGDIKEELLSGVQVAIEQLAQYMMEIGVASHD